MDMSRMHEMKSKQASDHTATIKSSGGVMLEMTRVREGHAFIVADGPLRSGISQR